MISEKVGQTRKIAANLAEKIARNKTRKRAAVIGLTGELGSGKTVFTQGFAKGLGIKGRIVSPTFILMRRHGNFYHFDAYRINNPKEILGLGFKKIINNPENIILIEWADRIKGILPKDCIKIKLEYAGANKRKISIA